MKTETISKAADVEEKVKVIIKKILTKNNNKNN